MWMIRGPPRAPDRRLESFGTRARRSEIFEIMMSACGPLNSGGSATPINVHSWPSTDVGHSGSWELTKWLVGHGVNLWCQTLSRLIFWVRRIGKLRCWWCWLVPSQPSLCLPDHVSGLSTKLSRRSNLFIHYPAYDKNRQKDKGKVAWVGRVDGAQSMSWCSDAHYPLMLSPSPATAPKMLVDTS